MGRKGLKLLGILVAYPGPLDPKSYRSQQSIKLLQMTLVIMAPWKNAAAERGSAFSDSLPVFVHIVTEHKDIAEMKQRLNTTAFVVKLNELGMATIDSRSVNQRVTKVPVGTRITTINRQIRQWGPGFQFEKLNGHVGIASLKAFFDEQLLQRDSNGELRHVVIVGHDQSVELRVLSMIGIDLMD